MGFLNKVKDNKKKCVIVLGVSAVIGLIAAVIVGGKIKKNEIDEEIDSLLDDEEEDVEFEQVRAWDVDKDCEDTVNEKHMN